MLGITLAQAAAGLALLYFGGEWLVRGAAALASRTGVSPLAIGLTVVAFGTSMPELVVSLDAALEGSDDIAVGNVVGSNIANVVLILGLASLLRPIAVNARVVRVDAPLLLVISLALVVLLRDGRASRAEGALLLLGIVAYTLYTLRATRRESVAVQDAAAAALPRPTESLWRSVGLAGAGLGVLVGGGRLLVESAIELAALLGVGQAAIGLTIVAVGTSLPELATSVVASLRNQGDIAVGNVVGSNIFNILGILGATSLMEPLELGGVNRLHLAVMVATAAVLTLLILVRPRLGRVAGLFLLAAFVAYTAWLFEG